MDIEEFEDLVDRFGEDLSRWPSPSREAGALLLKASSEAREIIEESKQLRAAFSRDGAEPAPRGLADRIMLDVRQARREGATSPALGFVGWLGCAVGRLRPAVVLPLCFLIGLMVSLIPSRPNVSGINLEVPTFFAAYCVAASVGCRYE